MRHLKILREKIKIFLAQTALHLEGIHLDEVQTKDLLNEENLKYFEVDEEDAIVMRNIVNTLNYLETIDIKNHPINLDLYVKLNEMLAHEQALETGRLRTRPVAISCIPDDIQPCRKEDVVKEIEKISNINNENFRQVIPESFCRLARMQPFFDGNKRSTAFLCNTALLKKDLGLLVINIENLAKFESFLTDYYTEKNKDILNFIGDELILSSEQIAHEAVSHISNNVQKVIRENENSNTYNRSIFADALEKRQFSQKNDQPTQEVARQNAGGEPAPAGKSVFSQALGQGEAVPETSQDTSQDAKS